MNLKTEIRNIKSFLDIFSTSSYPAKILCHSLDNAKTTKMKNYVSIRDALIANQDGRDVYFYVNNGGTKKQEIKQLVSFFVDLDAGRDTNGNYLPTKEVVKAKYKMMDKISHFSLKPHIIVETRNGYHAYWLIQPKVATAEVLQRYQTVQSRLSSYFSDVGADAYVGKCNQLMRVPFTMWTKTWSKKEEFKVRIVNQRTQPAYNLDAFAANTKNIVIKARDYTKACSYTGPRREPRVIPVIPGPATKPDSVVYQNKVENPTATSEEKDNSLAVVISCKDFLQEIAPQLFYKGMKYSSKQAQELVAKLSREFSI